MANYRGYYKINWSYMVKEKKFWMLLWVKIEFYTFLKKKNNIFTGFFKLIEIEFHLVHTNLIVEYQNIFIYAYFVFYVQ